MQNLVCAFCGKDTVPLADKTGPVVKYRCEHCGSLIAAYAKEYEEDLRGGNLFNKYSGKKYSPKLPNYIKPVEPGSD